MNTFKATVITPQLRAHLRTAERERVAAVKASGKTPRATNGTKEQRAIKYLRVVVRNSRASKDGVRLVLADTWTANLLGVSVREAKATKEYLSATGVITASRRPTGAGQHIYWTVAEGLLKVSEVAGKEAAQPNKVRKPVANASYVPDYYAYVRHARRVAVADVAASLGVESLSKPQVVSAMMMANTMVTDTLAAVGLTRTDFKRKGYTGAQLPDTAALDAMVTVADDNDEAVTDVVDFDNIIADCLPDWEDAYEFGDELNNEALRMLDEVGL